MRCALTILGLLLASAALAHDGRMDDWFTGLHSRRGVQCCIGDDTDPFQEWERVSDHYRVKYKDQWFEVPEDAVVDEPNRVGTPLLWMNKGWGGLSVRCFMPGTLS